MSTWSTPAQQSLNNVRSISPPPQPRLCLLWPRSSGHGTQRCGSTVVGGNYFDRDQVEAEVADPAQESVELTLVEGFGHETGLARLGSTDTPGNVELNRAPRRPWTVTLYRLDCIALLPASACCVATMPRGGVSGHHPARNHPG